MSSPSLVSVSTSTEPGDPTGYALYITACPDSSKNQDPVEPTRALCPDDLRNALAAQKLQGTWDVTTTPAGGLLVAFSEQSDANAAFCSMRPAEVLGGPVRVAALPRTPIKPFQQPEERHWSCEPSKSTTKIETKSMDGATDTKFESTGTSTDTSFEPLGKGWSAYCSSEIFLIKEVPWSVSIKDMNEALRLQFVEVGFVERNRQNIRIEVKNCWNRGSLLRKGLNFFDVATFPVVPEIFSHHTAGNPEEVIQCYRCQGFWHVAANCRHLPRCVRCGDLHIVDMCLRPRNSPVCCHCSGPHHAAYKLCPVRMQLSQAAPIAFTLSNTRPKVNLEASTPSDPTSKSTCML